METLATGNPRPNLAFRSGKDCKLHISGRDISDVQVIGKGAKTLKWKEEEGVFHLSVRRNATVEVPRHSVVELVDCRGHVEVEGLPAGIKGGAVGGHARFEQLGSLTMKDIGGHCSVNGIFGQASLGAVGGHLNAHDIGADLNIPNVGGHAKGAQIAGQVRIANVGGHFHFHDISGFDDINTGGHARVGLTAVNESHYAIRAGGNIALELPQGADATVHMSAGNGDRVQVLGDGSAEVQLNAGGQITISTNKSDSQSDEAKSDDTGSSSSENVAQQVQQLIEGVINKTTEQLHAVMDGYGMTADKRVDLQTQFSEIQNEAKKAAQEAAAVAYSRSRNLWEQEVKPNLDFLNSDPGSNQHTGQTVSPEARAQERMMILRMLEEGKISVEEANNLLEALGS